MLIALEFAAINTAITGDVVCDVKEMDLKAWDKAIQIFGINGSLQIRQRTLSKTIFW